MRLLVDIIDVLFRRIQPERTRQGLQLLNENVMLEGEPEHFSTEYIPRGLFSQLAKPLFSTLSEEEIDGIYQMACNYALVDNGQILCNSPIYASLLAVYRNVLNMVNDKLVVRYEHLLTWQRISLAVGQDLCTTAAYAYHDFINHESRESFTWETMLRSDCQVLHTRLREGIAENHSHLGGTAQVFALNWAYLMNRPNSWNQADTLFKHNLNTITSFGTRDNMHTWTKRIRVAATLRCKLFKCLKEWEDEKNNLYLIDDTYDSIQSLQLIYGKNIRQVDETEVVLDYALESAMTEYDTKHPFRILAAERRFMYLCFKHIFMQDRAYGSYDDGFAEWFYLYLIIKSNVRSELVQNNNRFGFSNFKDYQDRKDTFYGNDSAYIHEQIRMAINGSMKESHIKLMETRIGPSKSARTMNEKIKMLDQSVLWEDPPKHPFFYVAHFFKIPEPPCEEQVASYVLNNANSQVQLKQLAKEYAREEKFFLCQPRNAISRGNALLSMHALERAFVTNPILRTRIVGIDAASTEIGCRPEVFAPAIVKLRHYRKSQNNSRELSSGYKTRFRTMATKEELIPHQYMFDKNLQAEIRLSLTYHVGEDFMDILDGLRAIDEAVRFLHMQRGDRIGHALALGVAPEVHYHNKRMRSIIKKQDCLDNLVWLIYAVDELGVAIDSNYLSKLKRKAEEYLSEIYGQQKNYTILDYYHSWKLRGDPPEWYLDACLPRKQRSIRPIGIPHFHESESVFQDNDHCAVERKNQRATQLYCLYHYSSSVRDKGDEIIEWEVTDQYIALTRAVQDGMQRKIADMGISIECNPTSNYLIGSFRDYAQHPIYRFFPVSSTSKEGNLRASINTDDLGVFDTSLENEYLLVAAALAAQRDSEGNRLYSDEVIERYIVALQNNGLKLSFGSSFVDVTAQDALEMKEATGLNLRSVWPI